MLQPALRDYSAVLEGGEFFSRTVRGENARL